MPEITFHVDTAAERLIRDQLSTFVTGSITPPYGDPVDGWVTLSNTWVDPIKKVLMLAPMRMLPAWHTTTSGIYTRLGKASFTLSETAKWNDVQNKLAGDTWIAGEDLAANSSGITTGTYAKNRGWYVSWFAFNALDDDQFIQFECGWNSSVSGASGVSLRFYSSGGVEVWKDGSQVGSGSIAGSRANQQNADRAVSVLIIPYNRRELLIVSNQGDGFVHTFEDIAEDDANPTIVGATNFWFRLPEGGTSQLQLAPLQFPTSGYAMGIKSVFKAPPGSGETAYHESFSVGAFYGTQSVSTSLVEVGLPGTAFTPDGTKQEAQIKATFTGDGISTSFLSGARSWFLPLTDAVAGTEADITDYVGSASFEYGILAANSQANITLLDYDAAEAALTLSGLLTMSNRPWEIRHDTTNTIFAGANDPPTYIRKVNAETETLTLSIRSIWKQLETFRFDDALPLDGYTLAEAFEAILTAAGLSASQYTISASTLSLGYGGSPSMGEFGLEVLPGDTAAEWIDRLHQDFCATWFIGIGIETGSPVINILSPADMESTPAQTIYMSREAAITATADPDMAIVYHDGWEEFRLEPEANEIWVTGYDPRSRRPIIVYYTDANSADPTITPALRPTNWLGEKRKYALIDPAITTLALAQEAAETLANRLTPNRVIATARGPMWLDGSGIPLVRGRLVTVDGIDWRIQSVRVVSRRETSTWQYRECEYLLERNEEAYPAGGRLAVIGQTARQIADFVKAGRRLWPVRVLRRGGDKLKGLPIEVLNLP